MVIEPQTPAFRICENYRVKQSTAAGAIQVSTGMLSILFDSVALSREYTYEANGFGIVCGLIFILTGSFGIHAAQTKSQCKIVTFMVMSMASAVFAFVLSAFGAMDIYNYITDQCEDSRFCPKDDVGVPVFSIMASVAFLEVVIAIWSTAIGCAAVCCGRQQLQGQQPMTAANVTAGSNIQLNPQDAANNLNSSPSDVRLPTRELQEGIPRNGVVLPETYAQQQSEQFQQQYQPPQPLHPVQQSQASQYLHQSPAPQPLQRHQQFHTYQPLLQSQEPAQSQQPQEPQATPQHQQPETWQYTDQPEQSSGLQRHQPRQQFPTYLRILPSEAPDQQPQQSHTTPQPQSPQQLQIVQLATDRNSDMYETLELDTNM